MPTVLPIGDGPGLFYEGRTNMIFGEGGSGKSWVALQTVAEAIIDGRDVPAGRSETVLDPRVNQPAPARSIAGRPGRAARASLPERALFPDRHPRAHKMLRRIPPYMAWQLRKLDQRYQAQRA